MCKVTNEVRHKDKLCECHLCAKNCPKGFIIKKLTIEGKEFAVGDKIDARDVNKHWYVGTIIKMKSAMIKVNFSGWDSSQDEWIKDNENIAFRGTKTNGQLHQNINDCECVKCYQIKSKKL